MKKIITLKLFILSALLPVFALTPEKHGICTYCSPNYPNHKEWLSLYDDNTFRYCRYEGPGSYSELWGRWERRNNSLILNRDSISNNFKVKEMKSEIKKPDTWFRVSTSSRSFVTYDLHVITPQRDTVVVHSDGSGRATVNCGISAFWIGDDKISTPLYKLAPTTNEVHIVFDFHRTFDNEVWILEHEDTLRPRNMRGDLMNHVLIRKEYDY